MLLHTAVEVLCAKLTLTTELPLPSELLGLPETKLATHAREATAHLLRNSHTHGVGVEPANIWYETSRLGLLLLLLLLSVELSECISAALLPQLIQIIFVRN